MNRPKWYHWLCLICHTIYAVCVGLICIVMGSDPSSRFHAIDDVFIRVLGVALVFFGIALVSRRKWAFEGAVIAFIVKGVEGLVTFDTACTDLSSIGSVSTSLVTGITILVTLVLYGAPVVLLLWMRNRIGLEKTDPPAGSDAEDDRAP